MVRIGIDAMGGDNAPEVVVKGALAAQQLLGNSCHLVLYGDRSAIEPFISAGQHIDIVHTSERIEMGDNPTRSFITKTDASIVVAFNDLAAGKIDGLASAGATGAMMVGAMRVIGVLPEVLRPTIAISLPTTNGGKVTILDIGLNIDCKAEVLEQYGTIGAIYSNKIFGTAAPRVALLNIGEERGKGNTQTKAAAEMMEAAAARGEYNFVGNIEPSHLFTGQRADVVVCDGFVGNMMLKTIEALHAVHCAEVAPSAFWQGLDYQTVGATPILGIAAPVMVAHGRSSAEAIKSMVLTTYQTIRCSLIPTLKEHFSR